MPLKILAIIIIVICDEHQNGTMGLDQGPHSNWENYLGIGSKKFYFLM